MPGVPGVAGVPLPELGAVPGVSLDAIDAAGVTVAVIGFVGTGAAMPKLEGLALGAAFVEPLLSEAFFIAWSFAAISARF
jgi:hypothetical protein